MENLNTENTEKTEVPNTEAPNTEAKEEKEAPRADDISLQNEIDKLKKLEDEYSFSKVTEIEKAVEELRKENAEILKTMKALLEAKEEKTPETPQLSIDDIREKRAYIQKIADVENELKKVNDEKFIAKQIKDKPYVEKMVKMLNITNQQQYATSILPQEKFLRETAEREKMIEEALNNDPFNKSKRKAVEVKYTKEQQNAIELANKMMSDVFGS